MSQQPPEWSWDLPEPPAPRRAHGPRRAGGETSPQGFGRTVAFTVLGTLLPGLGLIAARKRVAGSIILGLFATVVIAAAIWATADLKTLASLVVRPSVLAGATIALALAAVAWVSVVVASHLSLRRQSTARSTAGQRAFSGILVGALAFGVAAPMAVAARYSFDQANLVKTVFKSEKDSDSATRPSLQPPKGKDAQADPWKDKPRLNILLLGSDHEEGRDGTRTDTVILASIDTKTGDTTMFSLPRQTARLPFPIDSPLHDHFPYGFTDGNGGNAEYYLNAAYRNVPAVVPPDILGKTDDLGADVLKIGVGEALGLKVDYYVMINLTGFKQMVNALGGITVNVNSWVPIGGAQSEGIPPHDWIEPGANQHLDGRHALWFARGRYGQDDYARMDRQRCVIDAIIKQANPANMLARYEDVAKAGKDIVKTDLPQEVLPMMVDLSLRVKDGKTRSIVFKNGVGGFSTSYPDWDIARQRVKTALAETTKAEKPKPKPSTTASKTPSKEPSVTSTPSSEPSSSASSTTESEDVTDSCAFDAEAAARAVKPN